MKSKHSILVQWSEKDKGFIATVPELPGLSAFGSTQNEAVQELAKAREAYLEVMHEDNEPIPIPETLKPFSGQTRVRMPKRLHASLSAQAKKEGVSLNTYVVHLLSERNAYHLTTEAISSVEDGLYAMAWQYQLETVASPIMVRSEANILKLWSAGVSTGQPFIATAIEGENVFSIAHYEEFDKENEIRQ